MRHFFLLLILCVPVSGKSQTVLIRAPQASPAEFRLYLKQHPDIISFSDHSLREIQKNPQQENRLFQLGDSLKQSAFPNVAQIKEIQIQSPLTLLSLRFIRDLTEKNLSLKISPSDRQELLQLYCKSAILLQEGPLLFPCSTVSLRLTELQRMYPFLEKILIESRAFSTQESISLNENAPYQWTLLSNAHKPLRFYGTFQQLINQRFVPENLIEGNCDEFTIGDPGFDILNHNSIFFPGACISNRKKSMAEKSWVSKKKSWIYAFAAMTVGGLIYALRDKTLVVTPP